MKFTLTIESRNAAMVEDGSEQEVSRMLRDTAQKVEDGYTSGYLRDYNGNSVGHWSLDK